MREIESQPMHAEEKRGAVSALPRKGYLYVALAAVLWAASGTSAKYLFNHGVTTFQLVQMRVTLSSVLLLGLLFVRYRGFLRLSPRDIPYFLILGVAGMAMVQFTYLYTISKINVAAAILLEYLAPIFIAVYAVLFDRDRLNRRTGAAIIGATFGCYLVVGGYNLDLLAMNIQGIIGGIFAAISFALYSLVGERGMRRYPPWTVLFYALLFAALFWNIVRPPLEFTRRTYSPAEWGLILYIIVLGTIVPFGLYLSGINLIRSTRASITATLEPITAAAISYVFLGEYLEPLQLLGGAMVIASIILLQLKKEYDDMTPDLIRAREQI